jgi:prolyl oligopeptidase
MKINLSILAFLMTVITACQNNIKPISVSYPITEKSNQSDDYFGSKVADPYRWLEDDTATKVTNWVAEQNKVTQGYLSQISFKNKLHSRIEEIINYEKYSSPFKKGNNLFFYKNNGLQNQSILYIQRPNEEPQAFLDPNQFSKEGTVALGGITFNNDNTLMAYSLAAAGSDWQTMYIKNVATGKVLSDTIRWIKFGGGSWHKDGLYYSGYEKPNEKKMYSNESVGQMVFYHKLGTNQSADKLIYKDALHPKRYYGPYVSEDEKFLFLDVSEGTYGTELWYQDLSVEGSKLQLLLPGFEFEYGVVDNTENELIVLTNDGAANKRLVKIDLKNAAKENWKDIITEKEQLLTSVGSAGGKLFAEYLKDACTKVYQYNLNGTLEHEIELPGLGTASGFGGQKTDKEFYYTYTSFLYPPCIFKYDIATGKSLLFKQSKVKFNADDYITEQKFFTSKDGKKVPMFIVHKKGIKMDGNNPCLLYSYGGFSINLTPGFNASRILFLENGGVYAMPNIRGGNEYGEEWHKGGMLANKQNVFDDFIGAAEFLIKEKYTCSEKLAISGRSNGGLLVGACMTQRPDLFKVALPGVGVLDMLRYHKFTVGWGWAVEYGSSDTEEDFKYLIKYSPLHNVKKVAYPATLITTADHDDRVVPAHSFKFAATLQENQIGSQPILIRIDKSAGHGAGKPISKTIDEETDVWSFVFYNLGIKY